MNFLNVYEDTERASSYANLEFPNTYYLAYRDLPAIIEAYTNGEKALDFGCGTGRSTRFLKRLGFDATGVDISNSMINMANALDPKGDYRLIKDGDLQLFERQSFDLILSVFTFDNIRTEHKKISILRSLKAIMKPSGRLVMLDSTPEIYLHEWASFSTKKFPSNHFAQSGDIVKIIMKDVTDGRPVEDVLWKDEDYLRCFKRSGLDIVSTHRPLASITEPYQWETETKIPPWIIYVLK